ncbi:MAG: copper resistance protein CopC [Chloroflexi bacterium]|nr:copper resistance protein CopC [Chloroflexota bacterium]
MNSIRRRLLTAVLALTASILLFPPRAAEAHAFLVRTTPEPGQRLGASLTSLLLQFSEPVINERVTVKTAGGKLIAVGVLQRLKSGLVVQAPLPRLDHGIYVVSWRENSADDGHLSLGEFAFAVGAGGALPPTASQVATSISWPAVAATWLFLGALLLAFGGLASERVVWQAVERQHKLTVPHLPIRPLLALSLVGGVAQLLLLLQSALNDASTAGGLGVGMASLTTRAGVLEVAQLALVGYGLWLVTLPWPRTRSLALAPLAGALVTDIKHIRFQRTDRHFSRPLVVGAVWSMAIR